MAGDVDEVRSAALSICARYGLLLRAIAESSDGHLHVIVAVRSLTDLSQEARDKLQSIPGVTGVQVELGICERR
jgi:hypothetical protein